MSIGTALPTTVTLTALLLSGCLSDEPPPPEEQPLEVIVNAPDSDYPECALNVDEVGAGTHEVTPISSVDGARIRIVAPSGKVVYRRTTHVKRAEGGGLEVTEEDLGSVRLRAGDYRVECVRPDKTLTQTLAVVPARPGFEPGQAG